MCRHNIRHKKGRNDKIRSALITKYAREIRMAVKVGGSNVPADNYKLDAVVRRALKDSISKSVIDKALQGAKKDATSLEEGAYDGTSPGGVAYLIETLSDNSNRTFMELKTIFKKAGGKIGGGTATFSFEKRGLVSVAVSDTFDEDYLFHVALSSGATDVEFQEQQKGVDDARIDVYTDSQNLQQVSANLRAAGFVVENERLIHHPRNIVELEEGKDHESVEILETILQGLSESADVCEVFTNADIKPHTPS